jgi:N,N'-diacetyllegionaminate synthase
MSSQVTVIAEIGVNHNGSVRRAQELIDLAVDCGADVVKFQTFSAERLASSATPKVAYQERDTSSSSHFDMLRSLELSESDHHVLFSYCAQVGIEFLSTPYGVLEAEFLLDLGVARFKTASADIVDLPLHEYLAATGRPVIASTGMASYAEVDALVRIYRESGTNLTLLHTTSEYPTPTKTTNLRRILALAEHSCPIGFSDHTESSQSASMAIAMGASVIERHITLDRADVGPDHFASDSEPEFRRYVQAIRDASIRMGSPAFICSPAERSMALTSRKSLHLVASRPSGWTLSEDDLVLRRPGSGLMWSERSQVVGRQLLQDTPTGAQISASDIRS